jgi:putative transposase
MIQRWKSEALEKMHLIFTKDSGEIGKIQKKHNAEVEDLIKQIGQLTIEVNWLKKNLASNKSSIPFESAWMAGDGPLIMPERNVFSVA